MVGRGVSRRHPRVAGLGRSYPSNEKGDDTNRPRQPKILREVMPFSENGYYIVANRWLLLLSFRLNSCSTWFQTGGAASHDDFTLLTRRLYIDCGHA